MRNVNDYAKFFLKKDLDSKPNTFDGNMKLQKLLFFANLINLAKYNELLFHEDMLAFEGGTVIEEVRLRYKNDYIGYKKDADLFNPEFDDNEYEVLNDTIGIFGELSARELSELNHTFDSWQESLELSKDAFGYHLKDKAVIPISKLKNELSKVTLLLDSYNLNKKKNDTKETILGIDFYYNPQEIDISHVTSQLENFAEKADETAYTIFYEEDGMVIM